MSNYVVNISAAIKAKLEAITSIQRVYEYEVGKVDNGEYPFATILWDGGEGEFGDTIRNIRRFRFVINLYQERTEAAFGNQKAERIIREIADEIFTAFDNDTRLGGAVLMVKPLNSNTEHQEREIGDMRVAQFTVEATVAVDSLT